MKPQTLNCLAVGLLLPALALASQDVARAGTFTFEDTAKNLRLDATQARIAQREGGYHLVFIEYVMLTERAQGTKITCNKLTADTAGNDKKSELQHGIAEGKVAILKTVQSAQGTQTTLITGAKADYRAGKPSAILEIAGPVSIKNANAAKQQLLLATGSKARAWLAEGVKTDGANALRKAIIEGKARVTVLQAKGGQNSKLVADGDRLTYDASPGVRSIVMEGHVNIHGEGTSRIFTATNQRRVVLHLNEKDEITAFDAEAYR